MLERGLSTRAAVVLASLAAAGVGGGLLALASLGSSKDLVYHTYAVIGTADGLLAALVDAETGQRGYLLTGDERYLEPYDRAQQAITQRAERLQSLVSDNPAQLARLETIKSAAAAKLSELAETIAVRRRGDQAGALAIVATGRGKREMDRLRVVFADLDAEERRLLTARTARLSSRTQLATVLIGISAGLLVLTAIVIGWGSIARQKTARRIAEHALSEQEAHARAILDLSPQVLWISEPDGEVREFADRWLDWTGLTRAAALGHGWMQVIHPDDIAHGAQIWQRCLATGAPYDVEYRVRMADGSYRWMRSRAAPRRDPETGAVLRWYGTTEDVHDRHEAEAKLRDVASQRQFLLELEERLRTASSARDAVTSACAALGEELGCHIVAVGELEADGEHIQIDSAWSAPGAPHVHGRRFLPDYGRLWNEPLFRGEAVSIGDVATDARTAETATSRAAYESLGIRSLVAVPLLRGGSLTAILFAARPVPGDWSEAEIALVSETLDRSWDALVRARAEEALVQSEARFRSTFEQAAVGVAEVGLDGRWLRVNRRLVELLAYPEAELLALTFQDITHPEDLDADVDNVRRLVAGEITTYTMEKRYVRKDGSLLPADLTVSLVRDQAGAPQHFISVIADASARKVAERALADALVRQRAIYASAPAGLSAHDRDLRFVAVNERLAAMNGVAAEAHIGRAPRDVIPATAEYIEPLLRRVIETGEPIRELEIETVTPAHPDRSKFYLASYYPIRRDRDHGVEGVSVAVLDIDARVRAEAALRDLAATLEQKVEDRTRILSDTVSELDAFAYTVSHDLRAPLRGMEGFAQALLEDHADTLGPEGRRYAERIIGAAQRMDGLISDLLEYSRLSRSEVTLRPLDLAGAVEGALSDLQDAVTSRHAIVQVQPAMPRVVASGPVMRQVLANLLGNAIKFVPPGERPVVCISAGRVPRPDGSACVRIWVEDNGIGVEPEHRNRIFRVFERLHADSVYPGTGIGLAIVRRGAERMGGTAGIEDRADGGRGSRFWVQLPAAMLDDGDGPAASPVRSFGLRENERAHEEGLA